MNMNLGWALNGRKAAQVRIAREGQAPAGLDLRIGPAGEPSARHVRMLDLGRFSQIVCLPRAGTDLGLRSRKPGVCLAHLQSSASVRDGRTVRCRSKCGKFAISSTDPGVPHAAEEQRGPGRRVLLSPEMTTPTGPCCAERSRSTTRRDGEQVTERDHAYAFEVIVQKDGHLR